MQPKRLFSNILRTRSIIMLECRNSSRMDGGARENFVIFCQKLFLYFGNFALFLSLTDREVCFAEFARNLAEIMSFWDFCSFFESEQVFDLLLESGWMIILTIFSGGEGKEPARTLAGGERWRSKRNKRRETWIRKRNRIQRKMRNSTSNKDYTHHLYSKDGEDNCHRISWSLDF